MGITLPGKHPGPSFLDTVGCNHVKNFDTGVPSIFTKLQPTV